jgi:hypothetical protein
LDEMREGQHKRIGRAVGLRCPTNTAEAPYTDQAAKAGQIPYRKGAEPLDTTSRANANLASHVALKRNVDMTFRTMGFRARVLNGPHGIFFTFGSNRNFWSMAMPRLFQRWLNNSPSISRSPPSHSRQPVDGGELRRAGRCLRIESRSRWWRVGAKR